MCQVPPMSCPSPGSKILRRINENGWFSARDKPLSTFSVDVDAASYGNVRRFLTRASCPPKDAVRIEELINYFDYDYPDPRGRHPFSITTEVAECPWKPKHKLVHIGLQGARVDVDELPPSNLVFLIDVSGSMKPAEQAAAAEASFRMLVDQLREQDRVAIVVYAGAAGLVLPSTCGSDKDEDPAAPSTGSKPAVRPRAAPASSWPTRSRSENFHRRTATTASFSPPTATSTSASRATANWCA